MTNKTKAAIMKESQKAAINESAIDRAKYELHLMRIAAIEEAAIKAWEADARHNPNPNNPHAYRNGFRAGAKEVIYNPEKYGLILYEDVNQLFDKRADESAMAFRKMRDELEAENQRLREALKKISEQEPPNHITSPDVFDCVDYWEKIAKEALKQQDND